MTIQDIKKAFVICCCSQDCTGCPILDMGKRNEHGCKFNLFTSVIDIVAEQEKEIERLRTTLGQCNTELNSALESLKSQCREIGELKAGTKQAKIAVLNELKVRHDYANMTMGYPWDISQQIDELIKEVENEQKPREKPTQN